MSFSGTDSSAFLYITDASHSHDRLVSPDVDGQTAKFTWRSQPAATEIILNGLKPSYEQLNNKINYLRKSHDICGDITTSGELEEAIKKHVEVPNDNDVHKPFVHSYKIDILPCGLKARFWISITTKNLLKRIKENPSKLFQIDGTYKLIWIPEKSKEDWSVQV